MAKTKNNLSFSLAKKIVVLVLVLFFATFAWFWYKDYSKDRFSDKDIPSWEVFMNNKVGYSLRVPPGWRTDENGVYNYPSDVKETGRESRGNFKLKIYENTPKATFPSDTPDVVVDGAKGKETYRTDWNTGITSIYFNRDGGNILISAFYNNSQKDKYERVFGQILSTFRFTK